MADGPPPLARLLGADRFLRLMGFVQGRPGVSLAFAALPVALLGGWLVWLAGLWQPQPVTHDGYLTARVLFSQPIASDDAVISTRFHIELPDGPRVAVTTRDLARAMNVIDTACVARLVDADGAPRYQLARPSDSA